ncbi:cupin domain-containing protein [Cobetia amphilecti]|uniref:cupin domain-containing protein n=1 Tax=Cobetia amphilecti TaxID=1055104 RepID=UPI001CDAF0F7|nr:cupin domain-containing protein [Cobetia amphilecti]UBU47480.1 cupin domain-containing protein [Cobetia amphilecti]
MNSIPRFIPFSSIDVAPFQKDISSCATAGNPQQNVWLYCNNTAAGARFGTWDCQAGSHLATMDGIIEFCYIIEGSAQVKNLGTGETHFVTTGDAFVMEPGLKTEWSVENYVKKYFVITDANMQDQ